MALIKCPECTKDVSDKAKNCPKCGCLIVSCIAADSSQQIKSETKEVKLTKLDWYIISGVLLGFIAFCLFAFRSVNVPVREEVIAQQQPCPNWAKASNTLLEFLVYDVGLNYARMTGCGPNCTCSRKELNLWITTKEPVSEKGIEIITKMAWYKVIEHFSKYGVNLSEAGMVLTIKYFDYNHCPIIEASGHVSGNYRGWIIHDVPKGEHVYMKKRGEVFFVDKS